MTILLILLGIVIAVPVIYVLWMHGSRLRQADADALIVLGYRCDNDEIHPFLKERLDTALRLMAGHSYSCVILSGGSVASSRSEAQIMYDYLTGCGVDPQLLVMEAWSRNTVQNMVNCELLMKERGLSTCLVVSNSFHIRRMNYIVKSLGIKALFYADRRPSTLLKQLKLTWQEIRAFRLTLPWLDKVAQMDQKHMMGKNN